MSILTVVITSAVSLIVLFLLTKLMGNKQVSQMNIFDYIIGISIGSIAAEMASELEDPWRPLTAMIVYAGVAFLISILTSKSNKAKKIITGRPLVLFDNGIIYRENLTKSRLDISELLTQCRINGYFDLSQLRTIIVENNGMMAFLPKSCYRPANPDDLSLKLAEESMWANVIMDGKILYENLKHSGKDETWLKKEMNKQGFDKAKEIMLACCDENNTLQIYGKTEKKRSEDCFE